MKTNMNDKQMLEALGITNANPFKTPAGYFDDLTSRVMKNIPSDEAAPEELPQTEREPAKVVDINSKPAVRAKKLTFSQQMIRWTSVAAACVALVFGGIQFFDKNSNEQLAENKSALSVVDEYDDEYGEELLSYSMMDTQDVYSYLAGDYN